MKRLIVPAVVLAIAAAVSVAVVSAGAGSSATLAGEWEATDPDDSAMTLWVRWDRGSYQLVQYDDLCTSCDPDIPAVSFGSGRMVNNLLLAYMEWWTLGESPEFLGAGGEPFTLLYDPAADTLTQTFDGVVWHRR